MFVVLIPGRDFSSLLGGAFLGLGIRIIEPLFVQRRELPLHKTMLVLNTVRVIEGFDGIVRRDMR